MDCSTPGLPVHHQLPELAQTHVHLVGDAMKPSHPLSSSFPPAFNLSQHRGLFQWVSSLHQGCHEHPSKEKETCFSGARAGCREACGAGGWGDTVGQSSVASFEWNWLPLGCGIVPSSREGKKINGYQGGHRRISASEVGNLNITILCVQLWSKATNLASQVFWRLTIRIYKTAVTSEV